MNLNRISAPTTQRRQLIDFLKGCRARLTPTQVGLPDTNRRRTPGLRREDVAALAGVSVTWYTWLEQGRDIQVSADVLERISSTLRMSPDEREYLFALVQHRPAPPTSARVEGVSPATTRMLDSLAVPAIVLTARWDVIGWNQTRAQGHPRLQRPAAGAAQLAAHPARRGRGVSAGPGALRSDGATASREVSCRLQPSTRRSRVRGADRRVVRFLSDLQSPLGSCRGRRDARGSRDSSAWAGRHVRAFVVRAGRQSQATPHHLHAVQRCERRQGSRSARADASRAAAARRRTSGNQNSSLAIRA